MKTFALLFFLTAAAANVSITFPEVSDPENSLAPQTPSPLIIADTSPLKANALHIANLGLKTLRDLFTGPDNVIISPFNIYSCLSLLELGAAGDTEEELRRVLGPPNENYTMRETITSVDGVAYASAVFLDRNFVVRPLFVDASNAEFQASVLNIDVSDGEEAKRSINSWVSAHTNKTINDLLQARLDPDTKMVIVSALLFKGKWLHSFPTAATAPGKFETGRGQVDVYFMHLLASVPILRNPHFDAISLPYIGTNGMTMHVLLPRVHGAKALKDLLSHLNSNSLRKLRKEAATEEIFIVIPKLKIECRFSLTNTLKQQGVTAMFSPTKANFTGVADDSSGLFVSQIYHSLHFEMDEEGTMASAATASILTKSSRFIFRANRPFIFVITEESDLVLFMGTIVNPLS